MNSSQALDIKGGAGNGALKKVIPFSLILNFPSLSLKSLRAVKKKNFFSSNIIMFAVAT